MFSIILLACFLGISILILSSFTQNTIAQCSEYYNTTYNTTTINGDGTHTFDLYNYVSGDATLKIANNSNNGTVYLSNCWTSSINSTLTVPHSCLSILNLTITFLGVNISNSSMTYNQLGTCAYPTNTYKALSTSSNIMYTLIQFAGIILLGVFVLVMLGIVIHLMAGG